MNDPYAIYRLIQTRAQEVPAQVRRFQLGLTWSTCVVEFDGGESIGFAMSPSEKSRTLEWPGLVAGQTVGDLAEKLLSWNFFDATLALAACNAVINRPTNTLLQNAEHVQNGTSSSLQNLAVFDYFKPKLKQQKIVIIGRYPNLDNLLKGLNYTVLERSPQNSDLPDTAAEYLIPQADWVFLTATSLINKSFSRLCQLAQNAVTVLMGPSVPWLPELANWHIDFVAGVIPTNPAKAEQIAAEGGGTRLFEGGVTYAVANLSQARLAQLKNRISEVAAQRTQLKNMMENWYQNGNKQRFPQYLQLEKVTNELAELDTAYKRLWDANKKP
jgi:uncharacterized protein